MSLRDWMVRGLLCALLGALLPILTVRADQPDTAWHPKISAHLLNQPLQIIDGRLALVRGSEDYGGTSTSTRGRESLTVRSLDPFTRTPTLHYSLTAQGRTLSIEFSHGNRCTIRLGTKKSSTPTLEYVQGADPSVTLTVTDQGTTRRASGATLWHLLLAEPDLTKQHLLPVLALIKPEWRLDTRAADVEEALLRTAHDTNSTERAQWSEWVRELASEKYGKRRNAARNLRDVGSRVLPFLRGLKSAELDPEQRERIRSILESYDDVDEDSSEQIAEHLMADRQIWLVLAKSDDEVKRRVAAEQLAMLLGEKIDFDPAAPAQKRSEQLARLTERVHRDEANLHPAASSAAKVLLKPAP